MKPAPSAFDAVYNAYVAKFGEAQARRWRAQYEQGKQTKQNDKPLEGITKSIIEATAPGKPVSEGQYAIDDAAAILAPDREGLGQAYPLALALVALALEAGHDPAQTNANSYHCLATFDTLGYMAARAVGRDKPYCSKTIQRWLNRSAPHAYVLRHYVGMRLWYTDTLINYETGKSIGKVVGGHVVRVYTRSLGGVVNPSEPSLKRQWRNLENDIKDGRTGACASTTHVHIGETTLRDVQAVKLPLYDLNTHLDGNKNLLEAYYQYPDIRQPLGVEQLRNDVKALATTLETTLEPNSDGKNYDHYLRAVWVAVKHHVLLGNREGYDLLKRALVLARELQITSHTLKNPAAYIWAMIEAAGFAELRRDCPDRLISRNLLEQISAFDEV